MAAKRQVKQKDHENLSEANIKNVISLLESNPPITKKQACEILNIAYNTKRLDSIIEGYKHRKEVEERNRAKKKGTPVTPDEVKEIIASYLRGLPVAEIARNIFRNTTFVNSVISNVGVPRKLTASEPWQEATLPEQCVSDDFSVNELAWCNKYNAGCYIKAKIDDPMYEEKYGCSAYKIYVIEPIVEPIPGYNREIGGFYANVLSSELGKLQHLLVHCPNLWDILKQ